MNRHDETNLEYIRSNIKSSIYTIQNTKSTKYGNNKLIINETKQDYIELIPVEGIFYTIKTVAQFDNIKSETTRSNTDNLLHIDFITRNRIGTSTPFDFTKIGPIENNNKNYEHNIVGGTRTLNQSGGIDMENNDILSIYIEKVDKSQSELKTDIRESEKRTTERINTTEERMDSRLNRIEDLIHSQDSKFDSLNGKIDSNNIAINNKIDSGNITIISKIDLNNKYVNAMTISAIVGIAAIAVAVIIALFTFLFKA